MARIGMGSLITQLRQYAQAISDEYTVNGLTYWTDDHLQDILDSNRTDVYAETITPETTYEPGGNIGYFHYYFKHRNVERATGGSAVWLIQDSEGDHVGTASYSVDYNNRRVSFTADTTGNEYYLTYRTYDLYRAAAEVWRIKAGHVAERYDVESDNHNLKRSQLQKQYLQQAAYYDQLASGGAGGAGGNRFGIKVMSRVDVNG